jgi:hypothetical protein
VAKGAVAAELSFFDNYFLIIAIKMLFRLLLHRKCDFLPVFMPENVIFCLSLQPKM